MRIAGLYLAAGKGSRMGAHKPSVELAPGLPLGRAALLELLGAGLTPLVVAVREGDPCSWFRVVEGEGAGNRLVAVVCRDAEEGMSRSIRCALSEALRLAPDLDGVMVALADQPMLSRRTIERYRQAFLLDPELQAVAGMREGEPVPPVLWSRSMFGELAKLEGDQGGRSLLRRKGLRRRIIPLDEEAGMDVDTPADLALARKRWPEYIRTHSNYVM